MRTSNVTALRPVRIADCCVRCVGPADDDLGGRAIAEASVEIGARRYLAVEWLNKDGTLYDAGGLEEELADEETRRATQACKAAGVDLRRLMSQHVAQLISNSPDLRAMVAETFR